MTVNDLPPSVLGVEPEMTYRVRTSHPTEPTDGSPFGTRQYWQVSEATLTGPRITAALLATGGDWMQMSPDGFGAPTCASSSAPTTTPSC